MYGMSDDYRSLAEDFGESLALLKHLHASSEVILKIIRDNNIKMPPSVLIDLAVSTSAAEDFLKENEHYLEE